jgi:hypothetical protein
LNVHVVDGTVLGTGMEGGGLTTTGVEARGLEQATNHRRRKIGDPLFVLIAFVMICSCNRYKRTTSDDIAGGCQ